MILMLRQIRASDVNVISRSSLSGLATVAVLMLAVCQEQPSALITQLLILWTVAMIVVTPKLVDCQTHT